MSHTRFGAIAEALKGFRKGHSIEIIDGIRACIGDEKDPAEASRLNVLNSVRLISEDFSERHYIVVAGAMYDVRDGTAEFLEGRSPAVLPLVLPPGRLCERQFGKPGRVSVQKMYNHDIEAGLLRARVP